MIAAVPKGQAQSIAPAAGEEKGFTFYEFYGGSFDTLGHVTRLDSTAGYDFNEHFGVDVGIPFYFVSSKAANTLPKFLPHPGNGIGDVYLDLRLTILNPSVNYFGTLRGAAPTGNTETGLSTGRATFLFDNYFDRDFGSFRPFIEAGIANSIMDTPFFFRPFTTLGIVVPLEAGASYKVYRGVRVGASAYADSPIGNQKVFSRLIRLHNPATLTPQQRRRAGVFEKIAEAFGRPTVDRDDGYSAWVDIMPRHFLDIDLGYDRSVRYALNTFSFGVSFNVGYIARRARGSL